jgi:hypothetical protein
MAELKGNFKTTMSPKNQAEKAGILAREIVDQHRELSVSSDRAAVEARIKQTFIEMSKEGRVNLDKLVGDRAFEKIRNISEKER